MTPAEGRRWTWQTVVAGACAAVLFAAVTRAAWSCDDAFISLRTVDNWVNGFGLRWNVDERVQSYTHPLWLLVVSLFYWPTKQPTLALIGPGLVATAAFLVLLVRGARDRLLAAAALLLLTASKAFVEFSTSGLENPLLHVELLLLAYFALRTLDERAGLPKVVLLASLLLATRMDQLLLVLPLVVGALAVARRELRSARTWLAASPFVAWLLFSIFYYGFPFPNTAYAKLNTGVPPSELMAQGARYLGANLSYDPLTLLTIVGAGLLGLASRRLGPALIGGGLLLWLCYLVRVGGDFMIGRLLTPALVLAVVVLMVATPMAGRRFVLGGAVAALLVAPWLPRSALVGAPRQKRAGWLPERVTDERAIFYPLTGLFRTTSPDGPRSHQWVQDVLRAAAQGKRVVPSRSVGFVGYFAGPKVHVVDEFALAEPLLARLPADPAWSPGHFQRALPPGYLATLESGINQIEDPTLASGYDELARIIRAPLTSPARLGTVLRWLLERPTIYPDDYQVMRAAVEDLCDAPGHGARVTEPGVRTTGRRGLRIELGAARTVSALSVALGADDTYWLSLRRGERTVWQRKLDASAARRDLLATRTLRLPEPLEADTLLVRGRQGDHAYHVGAVSWE